MISTRQLPVQYSGAVSRFIINSRDLMSKPGKLSVGKCGDDPRIGYNFGNSLLLDIHQ